MSAFNILDSWLQEQDSVMQQADSSIFPLRLHVDEFDHNTPTNTKPTKTNIHSLQIRQARKQQFVTITHGMEVNSFPYKYRVQVTGTFEHDSVLQMQLIMCDNKSQVHLIQGMEMDKVKWLDGSSKGTEVLEARLTFLTQSWAHDKCLFCLRIVINQEMVFESEHFELLARRNRKRIPSHQV